ncbi:hypothetical protein Thi970DRAFT_00218 [Thiorhodovibrio frisius]|uniref:Uncharacterized protein n=1 Tax=Thiorhodovibrio frisius TaxID=631362 RepID=H8YWB5_9GAMM|nr:hypothetical protein Thi970DRAFT_00218 [Thiorhodovibrio frisius]WPL20108.1 hypothetical protein Thiofri_00164 [Thiorhodovibrio frisius]
MERVGKIHPSLMPIDRLSNQGRLFNLDCRQPSDVSEPLGNAGRFKRVTAL